MADQSLVAKRIAGTNALVDGFRFQSPEFPTYFLTHAHSDHTTGLTRGFCAGTIYCSPVTAALILHDTPRVKDQARVVALEVGKTHRIRDGKCGSFEVTLVDANHCPGACVLVFDIPVEGGGGGGGGTATKTKRRIVHTGDFRFHSSLHGEHPLLLSSPPFLPSSSRSPSLNPNPVVPIDTLLLDTTYAHPRHDHPEQELAIKACAEFCRREVAKSIAAPPPLPVASPSLRPQLQRPLLPRPLFVFGSYRIGKERLYLGVAEELGWKIWVPPQKRRLLELLGLLRDDDGGGGGGGGGENGSSSDYERKEKLHLHRRYLRSLLADSPTAAVLHVAPMGASLTPPALLSRLQPGGDAPASGCGRVIGIRPTGWTWRKPRKGGARDRAANEENDLCSALVSSHSPLPNVTVAGVPYSEHSSFPELRAAVAAMKPRRLVPTVTGGTAGHPAAIVERFSDLLDRKRDRSRLDFFFSSKKKVEEKEEKEEEEEEGGEFDVKVEDEETAATAAAAAAATNDDIEVKEERGSDGEEGEGDDDDDSWGPPRAGDDWALDDDDGEEEMKGEEEETERKEKEKATAAGGGPSAAPPPVPFDLASVDAQEQRRILAEIQAVATAEKLLRDQREGNGKRGRQPTLAAFAAATAAAGKKKKE